MVYMVCNRNQYWVLSSRSAKSWNNIKILMLFQDFHVRPWFVKIHYFQVDYCIKTSKEKCVFMLQLLIRKWEGLSIISQLSHLKRNLKCNTSRCLSYNNKLVFCKLFYPFCVAGAEGFLDFYIDVISLSTFSFTEHNPFMENDKVSHYILSTLCFVRFTIKVKMFSMFIFRYIPDSHHHLLFSIVLTII